VRDLFTADVDRLSIDSPADHARVLEFVTALMPRLASRVHLYEGLTPMFDQHGVEAKIARALERRVWLKSGGYLIFDQTESLTTGRRQHRALRREEGPGGDDPAHEPRGREAGRAAAPPAQHRRHHRHRLHRHGEGANRKKVFEALQEAVRRDKARTNVLRISELGLVEMTRKRTRESLEQRLTSPCPHCGGNGRVRSVETVAYDALRRVQREVASATNSARIALRVHPDVATFLNEQQGPSIAALEALVGRTVAVESAPELEREQVEVSLGS
jgi:ribonuclease G